MRKLKGPSYTITYKKTKMFSAPGISAKWHPVIPEHIVLPHAHQKTLLRCLLTPETQMRTYLTDCSQQISGQLFAETLSQIWSPCPLCSPPKTDATEMRPKWGS